MYSEDLIKHPKLQPLINEFKDRFPDISLESNMAYLGWFGYAGFGLGIEEVEEILHKCLRENKYFKVWHMSWKGKNEEMPCDWWEGKVVYYKYKGGR